MTKNIGGGLAAWSIRHPIGVVMITLAVMVLGVFALGRLGVDLLPHIIYPDVRVRVLDPGVPASIMEDRVTRQLEEQLAITEDAIHIQSRTSEGRSAVDLSFAYGTDIDQALRDASTRLDRAKRFLPDSIEAPVIYKRDPSQRPVAEFVVSSTLRDAVELRSWADYDLGKWFLTLPGVAAAEVGGGRVRQIQVIPDQIRLAGLDLQLLDLEAALQAANQDTPGGRLMMPQGEISGRTAGRFRSVEEIAQLPLRTFGADQSESLIYLSEVAQVVDGAEDETLRIRLNQQPGVKLSIQKQPQANTIEVVDGVLARLAELEHKGLIPEDIEIRAVDDQARYIRRALSNALNSAAIGGLLAMLVVYLFLGSLRRTLIIGSAIPIAILVTFILMSSAGLTLNIMTLGGLALGIGMLVDSTIVMLENIYRHQRERRGDETLSVAESSGRAASEVNSAIVAATTTNLAAVLPFLFIGGLVGLLFRELIFTISAAIVASLMVALTLVPALAGRIPARREALLRRGVNRFFEGLQAGYGWLVRQLLRVPWLLPLLFIAALALIWPLLSQGRQVFLPNMDEGRIYVSVTADRGINLPNMDRIVRRLETLFSEQPEVETIFTQSGGSVFGRSQYQAANRASLQLTLKPIRQRGIDSRAWVARMKKAVKKLQLPGVRLYMRVRGIRGIRLNRGEDDVDLRLQGPDLETLARLAEQLVVRLREVEGLSNLSHSSEDVSQEISVRVDRERAARFGLSVEDVGRYLQLALGGIKVTEFLQGDRSVDVRLRLSRDEIANPADVESIIIFSRSEPRVPLRLGELAQIELLPAPSSIHRDQQRRVVEISASLGKGVSLEQAMQCVDKALEGFELPAGYRIYDGGGLEQLREGREMGQLLLGLALFLVFVVMAVQYESLRNPLVIMLSVPFALIGVVLGLQWSELSLSMPVWLGLIMLAGIVVNNAIVLVEYISLQLQQGVALDAAIVEAARLRLRPILMTTLTTVAGMLPLALALGEGAEMLQPLAVTIVSGLSFSTLVTLLLIPAVYRLIGARAG
ncbi:Multidrug efflux pump subunit AcrB [endosymbiont of Ridgeia piscesae]|jgi:CzcA family heavy metal efflux pump|uniref:Multidrug efflux pump subunit AcrB n=3 Tax=endosymbiont of Ridgeia piscesae TaxID=54398 RepID=A0A0T5YSR0_9GAMM|nr:efflux RND transporter permease subunit [endosymbiont of Ridgeia piscesae]KRT53636.1 Multidrug efflux pump subunit AcrB [endosymbiont of Ridgeia piscesae]